MYAIVMLLYSAGSANHSHSLACCLACCLVFCLLANLILRFHIRQQLRFPTVLARRLRGLCLILYPDVGIGSTVHKKWAPLLAYAGPQVNECQINIAEEVVLFPFIAVLVLHIPFVYKIRCA